ncbi:MAG TPA: iron ABC transporter substrate-binding protein [Chloroflexota bacterium]|nr:iron ABC transporter substrate-binding protein [Chloroflexota bacterium]
MVISRRSAGAAGGKLCAALGLLTCIALAACGGNATSSSGSSAPASTAARASGAASPAGSGASSNVTINLYNGQHASTTNALVAGFTKQTGIKVQVRSAGGSGLANQIIEEGSSSPADVVYAENSPELMILEEKGLLASVNPDTLARVPSQYNSPTGKWVGVAARAAVLAYNPDLLPQDQLPKSILDLAKPNWQGKIALAPTESDFQPVISAVMKLNGQDAAKQWLEGLKRNGKTFNGNTAILTAVNNGQIAAGLINNYYWFRQADQAGGPAKMKAQLYYFGNQDAGALVDVSPVGALASSKHPAEAQRFMAYLVSPEGQQILVDSKDYEYPLAIGAKADPALKPLADLAAPNVTVADLGDGRAAVQLEQQVGLL